MDLFASFADMLGMELPDDAAIDSQDQYAALVGKDPVGRKELLVEDVTCGKMLRSGNWTYLSPSEGSPYMKQVLDLKRACPMIPSFIIWITI